MQREGLSRRPYDTKSYIQKVEKNFVLAQLVQDYGFKANQMLSDIEARGKLEGSDKIIEEYQGFRFNNNHNSSQSVNSQAVDAKQQPTVLADMSKVNFQL